jgi:putative ABC transport system permease protein
VLLVDQTGADLWIVQQGTKGPFAERSSLPASIEDRARATPGVAWARPFSTYTTQIDLGGRPRRVTMVGVGWPEDRGEMLALTRGRPLESARGEMIADAGSGLSLGDVTQLGDERLRVVGATSRMVGSGGDPVLFVTHADLLRISTYASPESIRGRGPEASAPAPDAHAFIVRVAPGERIDDVAARITRWGDVSVFSASQQRDLLLRGVIDKARKQIGLFRVLLAVVSGIVVSLVVFNMTAAKTREIALLRLMGAKNRLIAGMILQQSLALCLLAFGVAVGVAQLAFDAFPRLVAVGAEDFAVVLALSVGIAIAASVAAVKRALSIPPTTILAG